MDRFWLCLLQYVLIACFLAGVAALGAYLGIRKRKASDAKALLEDEQTTTEDR